MTRAEAIEIVIRTAAGDRVSAAYWIDIFVALGMLKLDEPASAHEKALAAMYQATSDGMLTPRWAIDAIDAAGLKIVEK